MVSLEAFFNSKCVLCSDVGGLNEIINKSGGGITFKKGSVIDLSKKMEYLIGDKPTRFKLGLAGHKFVLNLTWKNCAKKTFKFYKEVLVDEN